MISLEIVKQRISSAQGYLGNAEMRDQGVNDQGADVPTSLSYAFDRLMDAAEEINVILRQLAVERLKSEKAS